jgi:hypothetical protein
MVIMGGLYGMVMVRLFQHPLQPLGLVYAAMVFVAVIRPETNLADSFGGALRAVVIWYVVQWYMTRRVRSELQAANRAPMPPPEFPPAPPPRPE